MVECEYYCRRAAGMVSVVLIDTWWNVNKIHCVGHLVRYSVLIDTWWNVNLQAQRV